jgi:hypothetical protein
MDSGECASLKAKNMTARTALKDPVIACVAYLAGLAALLIWPNRASADQNLVFLGGMAIVVGTGLTADWLVHRRRPTFDLLAYLFGPRPSPRPWRYSFPNFLGMFTGLLWALSLSTSAPPDWGITAYGVSAVLLLTGVTVSNLLWAIATTPKPDGIHAR